MVTLPVPLLPTRALVDTGTGGPHEPSDRDGACSPLTGFPPVPHCLNTCTRDPLTSVAAAGNGYWGGPRLTATPTGAVPAATVAGLLGASVPPAPTLY